MDISRELKLNISLLCIYLFCTRGGTREIKEELVIAKKRKGEQAEHIPGKFLYTLCLFILHERESTGEHGRARESDGERGKVGERTG
jgi:hypothetical protein